jgi:hypothetical protein
MLILIIITALILIAEDWPDIVDTWNDTFKQEED